MPPPSTTEQPHSQAVGSYSASSWPQICKETHKQSDTQNEEKTIWITAASETQDATASGGELKQKCLSNLDEEASSGVNEGETLYQLSDSKTMKTKRGRVSSHGFVTKDTGHTVTETAERNHTEEPLVQFEPTGFPLESNSEACVDRNTEKMETRLLHSSDVQLRRRQRETYREGTDLPKTDTDAGQRGEDREMLNEQLLSNEEMSKPGKCVLYYSLDFIWGVIMFHFDKPKLYFSRLSSISVFKYKYIFTYNTYSINIVNSNN